MDSIISASVSVSLRVGVIAIVSGVPSATMIAFASADAIAQVGVRQREREMYYVSERETEIWDSE